jgi:pimeloyl-ACP methyl ester carboxylesterase
MAPGDYELYGQGGLGQVTAPVLLMTGDLDTATGPDAESIWAGLSPTGARYLRMPHFGHQTFTDFAGTLDSSEDELDPVESFRIIRTYILGFAQYHSGDDSMLPLLDGTRSISDEAVVEE